VNADGVGFIPAAATGTLTNSGIGRNAHISLSLLKKLVDLPHAR